MKILHFFLVAALLVSDANIVSASPDNVVPEDQNEHVAIAPLSLEQAVEFVKDLDSVELSVDLMLRPAGFVALKMVKIQDRSFLHIDAVLKNDLIDPDKTQVHVVDDIGNPVKLRCMLNLCSVRNLELKKKRGDSTNQTANLVVNAKVFGLVPFKYTIVEDIALDVSSLLESLSHVTADANSSATKATSHSILPGTEKSLLNTKEMRYDLRFVLKAGSTLDLNEGTAVRLNDNGTAEVRINGVRDYTKATVTGTDMSVMTSMLETGASDLDLQVTLNRSPEGKHYIAFNNSTLRGLKFKTSDFEAPKIDRLLIKAKDYDFIVTIDPHNSFTVEDLIEEISARIGNPALVAKFRKALTERASQMQDSDSSAGPTTGPLIIDSSQMNLVDYMTHGLRDRAKEINNLPHIRRYLDDPAIEKLATAGVLHLQAFMASKQLQYASIYGIEKLKQITELAFSRRIYDKLKLIDSEGVLLLMKALKFSEKEISSFPTDKEATDSIELQIVTPLGSSGSILLRQNTFNPESYRIIDDDGLEGLEQILIRLGDTLNKVERAWLRESFIDGGGMESDGAVYALAANLIEELHAGISSDPGAPKALLDMITAVPLGETLDRQIAVGAVNIQGAIWASQGILKKGWLPVSERLEARARELYGDDLTGRGMNLIRKTGSGLPFVSASTRMIGDGEEFFQQIYQLLEENERAFSQDEKKGTIVLNHWAFEAVKGNSWALGVANRLHDLALKGFHISIISDGKAGPSTRGQVFLRELAASVLENGLGSFHVHSWFPKEENFPTGTHVKYICTSLGVVAGGSNLGDHYAHWTDTNFLLRGQKAVDIFGKHHFDILQQQRDEVGHNIPDIPFFESIAETVWEPLQIYEHHHEKMLVFHPEWQDIDMRLFRDMGGNDKDRILVENIALIECATPGQTVYIINCYVIITQPVQESYLYRAFQRALERGVNIEILTNTHDSIDVKETASPMHDAYYFALKLARDISLKAKEEGRKDTGKVFVHYPDKLYIPTNDEGVPDILIHDKATFGGNLALIMTTNFHPRSFTMEMELVTEMFGSPDPPEGKEHSQFIQMAREFLEHIKEHYEGGERIEDVDTLLYPLDWHDNESPEMWGPSAILYLQFLEKRFKYCITYSSDNDEDIAFIYSTIDDSTVSLLFDLGINAV